MENLDIPQIITSAGTLIGSAVAAYFIVRSRSSSLETRHDEIQHQIQLPKNGERTLRASIENILERVKVLQDEIQYLRQESQTIGSRLHLVERDILRLSRPHTETTKE